VSTGMTPEGVAALSPDAKVAAAMAFLGVPTFACTPELFPGMMAATLQKQDLSPARNDIVTARGTT
jgi:hypothetical protein